MIGAPVLAGAVAGAGLWLLAAALFPARPAASAQLRARADAARPAPGTAARGGLPSPGLLAGPARVLAGWPAAGRLLGPATRADLTLLGVDPAGWLAGKLLAALGALAAPPWLAAVLSMAGVRLGWLAPAWAALCLAAAGFLLPDLRLRAAARARRAAFGAALAGYLDLVAMRMAAGAGLPEALREAARVGDGPAFALLRQALDDARLLRLSMPAALDQLAGRLGLPDLADTAARLALTEATGAQAQLSLRAQAASLRDRRRTDLHGRAQENTQTMLVAELLLALGFVIFLGYPAVAKVLAT